MSVRIHQLSKQIGIENKELIAILQERGFTTVKSASSTIDNISAESLLDEFRIKHEAEQKEAEEKERQAAADQERKARAADATVPHEAIPAEPAAVESAAPAEPAKPSIKLPPGVFVKSADDVRREREERAAAARPASTMPARPAAPPTPPARPSAPPVPPPPVSRPSTPPSPASVSPAAKSPGTPPPVTPPMRKAPGSTPSPAPLAGAPPKLPEQAKPEAAAPAEPAPQQAGDEVAPPAADEVKVIQVKPPIVVRDFAGLIGLKPFRLISELMEMNIFASMNQTIEESVATELAARHGFLLDIRHRGEQAPAASVKKEKPKVDESQFLEPRPPIVCILGHVDHGKTTLLDHIRKANVVAGEAGGITQHIGAYQVEQNGRKLTFLDTPGHAAFSKMRARGATVTDIAILVVAADDGFMPQTDEALKHAQTAKVPLVVAINKMDARGANPDRVKKQMQDRGIPPEEWGGETITVPISALKGDGIDHLLEMVLLQSEVLELKANPKAPPSGVVVEAQIEVGRGPTATVIVQKGTLKPGDALVCGAHYCKVRAMFDDQGRPVKSAPPATPVRVIGWSDAPRAGSVFDAVKNEREAKSIAEERAHQLKMDAVALAPAPRAASIEELFKEIASQKKKTFRAVVRCDVHGSVEAVVASLKEIKSDKVDVEVVQAEAGLISANDVLMASASGAAIIGFNVKMENGVKNLAKHHGVNIQTHEIIYELIDTVKLSMADLLDPEVRESKLGAAEVRQIFPVSKAFVAGCLVTEGKIVRDSKVRLLRQGKVVFEGRVSTLKRFKDDATEVRAGYECGVRIDEFNAYQPGDVIEAYDIQKIRANL